MKVVKGLWYQSPLGQGQRIIDFESCSSISIIHAWGLASYRQVHKLQPAHWPLLSMLEDSAGSLRSTYTHLMAAAFTNWDKFHRSACQSIDSVASAHGDFRDVQILASLIESIVENPVIPCPQLGKAGFATDARIISFLLSDEPRPGMPSQGREEQAASLQRWVCWKVWWIWWEGCFFSSCIVMGWEAACLGTGLFVF